MLRLMDIQPTPRRDDNGRHIYEVTLDRDGVVKRYDFLWTPPSRPGGLEFMNETMDAVADLIDYEVPPTPGKPCGAFVIPVLRDIMNYVAKSIRGKTLDFPIVLDER